MEMLSAAATTLAVFARPGDAVWTPHPVAPERIPHHLWPNIAWVSSPSCPPAARVLPWGQTGPAQRADHSREHAKLWFERLWQLPTDRRAALRCHHRRFCLELPSPQPTLPGTRRLTSMRALHQHLHAGGADAGHDNAWVVKAPLCASGRSRYRQRGIHIPPQGARRIERLLSWFRELVFEPWMNRIADFGCCGVVEANDRWTTFPVHELECDSAGVFRGIRIGAVSGLSENDTRETHARANAVASALATAGYRGPFSTDGFRYVDAQGTAHLHTLCEINARMTFGHVARALHQRLMPTASTMEFRMSRTEPPPGATTLLHSAPNAPLSIWIQAIGSGC